MWVESLGTMVEPLDLPIRVLFTKVTLDTHGNIKQENNILATCLQKFTKVQYLQIELVKNTIINLDRIGIWYQAHKEKNAQQQPNKPKPKPTITCLTYKSVL